MFISYIIHLEITFHFKNKSIIVERANRTGLNFRSFKLFEGPIVAFEGTSVQNFSQIRPFLKSPGCPKVLASFWRKTRPQAPKIKIFEKWKKQPQIFTQGTSVQDFSQIRPFLKSPGCPKVFWDKHTHRQKFSDSSSTEVENILPLGREYYTNLNSAVP